MPSLSAAEPNPRVKIKSGRVCSFGCGDVTFNVDYGLAVVVCGGAQSMCKDKKWTCVLFRPRRRPHSMCKDKKWPVGLLIIGLPSLSAAKQNPCVKIKSGRGVSFGRRQVNNPCVKINRGRVFSFGRTQVNNPCVKMNSGRVFSFGRSHINNPCVKINSGRSVC